MNAVAGISGGRTSAMMAYGLDAVLCFQNTGREAKKTYEFIQRLEQDLGREIVRLEFRAPPRGEPPVRASFEIVDHRHLARRGEPFTDLLECIRTYRAKHKGLGPVAPWARSRICTAYLKIRTQRKFCASLGWGHQRDYTEFVGLRFDEPGVVDGRVIWCGSRGRWAVIVSGVEPEVWRYRSKSAARRHARHVGNCAKIRAYRRRDVRVALDGRLEPTR